MKSLYLELMAFKSDPEFKEVGFAICCKYNKWMKRVEALRDTGTVQEWLKIGVLPGDLLTLGLEYMQNKGRETALTRLRVPAFKAALFRDPPKKNFTGTVVSTDRYCKSLATYKRQFDLVMAQRFADAQDVIDDDSLCTTIYQNTPARGPLDKKIQNDISYVLVDVQGVGQVWAMADYVEFAAP